MNTLEFTLLVWLGSFTAGFLGSLTGLGGGVVVTPLLALAFGVDIRVFSLIAFAFQRDRLYVIATSIVLAVLLYSLIGTH